MVERRQPRHRPAEDQEGQAHHQARAGERRRLRRLVEGKKANDYVFTQARGGMLVHRNFWSRYWRPGVFRAQQCAAHRAELEAAGCKCGTATPARCKVHRDMAMPAACGCAGTLRQSPCIHDLRHTHASWLLATGVPIHVVQARLGHESIQTTVDTYSHLLPDAQLAAAAAASLAFAGTATLRSQVPALDLDAPSDDALATLAAIVAAKALERGVLAPHGLEAGAA